MKRILVFIVLKIAEIVAVALLFWVLWRPVCWFYDFVPTWLCYTIGIVANIYLLCYFCAVIWKKLPQKWIKTNWQWAGKILEKRKND